jgi:hypothetical protein
MKDHLRGLLLVIVVVVVLWYVLSRLHIVILVPLSPWGLVLLILGVIVVSYLVIDHFINRAR